MVEHLTRPLDALPDPLPIPPLRGVGRHLPVVRVCPPGSKSLTNRALLLGALASGISTIRRALTDADDVGHMAEALRRLGARIDRPCPGTYVLDGTGGRWRIAPGPVRLDAGNAGTAARFLAAAALLADAPVEIDGSPRMRQRPIGELGEALGSLGADVRYAQTPGYPPVRITPPARLPHNASLTLRTTVSSQFISALLLIAPWLPGGLTLRLDGDITSRSYVLMTIGLLDALGATVRTSDDLRVVRVAPARASAAAGAALAPFEYTVEPDASSATYFWAAAALIPGAVVRVEGLGERSLQGDAEFPDLLARMGATVLRDEGDVPTIGVRGPASLAPILADMSSMPDAALTLAVLAAFASGRSIIRGLRTLRVKESDRIAALVTELARVGVRVDTDAAGDPGTITITPPSRGVDSDPNPDPVCFETYDDHRLAMALALIGLRRANVSIRNPACVRKTYPDFWRDLARLY